MLGRVRSEFQCLERESQNSSVWNNKLRIIVIIMAVFILEDASSVQTDNASLVLCG